MLRRDSSAVTLYQSKRTATGWTTNALTPKPPNGGLVGLFAEQAPLWWTGDLTQDDLHHARIV